MSKFIKGNDVVRLLDIEDFELMEYVKKGLIRPYNEIGKRICDITIADKCVNSDDHRLYNLKLDLGDPLFRKPEPKLDDKYKFLETFAKAKKAEAERQIKELEARGVKALSLDQVMPDEYKDCLWDEFDLPPDKKKAKAHIEKFKGYLYLKDDIVRLKPKGLKLIQAQGSSSDESIQNTWFKEQEQLEKIQICYENQEQFKIRMEGKPFKPCTYHDLGCRNKRTKEFEYLLEAIESGHVSLYDTNKQKVFKRACNKLVKYIKKEYLPDLPDNSKIFEKDDNNDFWLIFKKVENADFGEKSNDNRTKEDLLKELKRLVEEKPPFDIRNIDLWQRQQNDKKQNISKLALTKGATKKEIESIILQKTVLEETLEEKGVSEYLDVGFQVK